MMWTTVLVALEVQGNRILNPYALNRLQIVQFFWTWTTKNNIKKNVDYLDDEADNGIFISWTLSLD
jgi:hypothetical protein